MNKNLNLLETKNEIKNTDLKTENKLLELKKIQYIRCPVRAIIINNNLFEGE